MAEAPNTYLSPVAIERGRGDSPLDTTSRPPTLYRYGVVKPMIYCHSHPIPNLSPIQNLPPPSNWKIITDPHGPPPKPLKYTLCVKVHIFSFVIIFLNVNHFGRNTAEKIWNKLTVAVFEVCLSSNETAIISLDYFTLLSQHKTMTVLLQQYSTVQYLAIMLRRLHM